MKEIATDIPPYCQLSFGFDYGRKEECKECLVKEDCLESKKARDRAYDAYIQNVVVVELLQMGNPFPEVE
jgi:hypothetical protein